MRKTAPALLAILAVAAIARAEDPAAPKKQADQAARQLEERAGQQPGQQATRRQAGFRGEESSAASFDSHVADCLILANQEAVAILKIGAERAQNEEVKQFAQKSLEDHEKALKELQKFASEKHAKSQLQAGTEERAGESRIATREARKPAAGEERTAAASAEELCDRMFEIQHRAARECLNLTQKELAKWKGAEFDQAFLGQQTGAHIGMYAHLKALEGEVSPELEKVIQHCTKVTMEHKDQADKLMTQLAKAEQGGERARPEKSTPETRKQQ